MQRWHNWRVGCWYGRPSQATCSHSQNRRGARSIDCLHMLYSAQPPTCSPEDVELVF